jgi:hypothetical protein
MAGASIEDSKLNMQRFVFILKLSLKEQTRNACGPHPDIQ